MPSCPSGRSSTRFCRTVAGRPSWPSAQSGGAQPPDAHLTAVDDEVRVVVAAQALTRDAAEVTARGELAVVFRPDRYRLATRNPAQASSEALQSRTS